MDSSPAPLVERVEARDEAANRYLADKGVGQRISARTQLTGANLLDTGYTLAHTGPIMIAKGLFIGSIRGLFAGIVGAGLMGMLGGLAFIGGIIGVASAPVALGIIALTTLGWAGAQAVTEYNHKLSGPNKGADLANKWVQKAGAAPMGEEPSKPSKSNEKPAEKAAAAPGPENTDISEAMADKTAEAVVTPHPLPAEVETVPAALRFQDRVGRPAPAQSYAAQEQAKAAEAASPRQR